MNSIRELSGKRILFLQGPMGGFFKRLDLLLRDQGAVTFKIGFNAGDAFFSNRDNYTPYRGKPAAWRPFITVFLQQKRIDRIYLFGDCRFYQRQCICTATDLGIDVFVFEEGYVRPYYITLEKYGVNGYSQLSKDRAFYDRLDLDVLPKPTPENTHFSMPSKFVSATVYYACSNLLHFMYPHYKHHRDFLAVKEAYFGIRNFICLWLNKWRGRAMNARLSGILSKHYYFVPLQTYNDFQIQAHSTYDSVNTFINEVLRAFALSAPESTFLVFKHHPVDRGRKNYKRFIMQQARLLGIASRIVVVHDIHLPSALKHALGTVTINSTVGLSSLYHGIPTISLGDAIYNIEGLTCKGMALERFWTEGTPPEKPLLEKYRRYLINTTQLNASFHGKMPTV